MRDILLFWPNIVGYLRFLCIALAFSKYTHSPVEFVALYLVTLTLDGVDGFLARRYNQCSSFGALLDMLCDRISSCGLLVILTARIDGFLPWGIFLIALDFMSHYVRMYATMMLNLKSHKEFAGSAPKLLLIYYEYRWFMCATYAAQEIWYLIMYLKAHGFTHPVLDAIISTPSITPTIFAAFLIKQYINVLQLVDSMHNVLRKDVKDRLY